MKNLIFLLLAALLTVSSCKDACDGKNCANGGACVDGECVCTATWYEGENCQTKKTAKYLGTYNATDACTFAHQVSVTENGISAVRINNLFEGDTYVNASLVSTTNDQLTIPTQTVAVSDGLYTVTGNAYFNGTTLIVDYALIYTDYLNSNNNFTADCIAYCAK